MVVRLYRPAGMVMPSLGYITRLRNQSIMQSDVYVHVPVYNRRIPPDGYCAPMF